MHATVVVIDPPLQGGVGLAANSPSNESSHRRAAIPIDGSLFIAQRFTIDYVKVSKRRTQFQLRSPKERTLLRLRRRRVGVAVKDGIAENVPGPTSRAVPSTLETRELTTSSSTWDAAGTPPTLICSRARSKSGSGIGSGSDRCWVWWEQRELHRAAAALSCKHCQFSPGLRAAPVRPRVAGRGWPLPNPVRGLRALARVSSSRGDAEGARCRAVS